MILDWNHVYILAWYHHGQAHLTTWDGDLPEVTVYVTGPAVQSWGPPIWNAKYNFGNSYESYTIHEKPVPGSVKANAWYIEEGFDRVERVTGIITRWGIDSTGGA